MSKLSWMPPSYSERIPVKTKNHASSLRIVSGLSCLALVNAMRPEICGATRPDDVYKYIYSVMDRDHSFVELATGRRRASFDVYTEKDAAGNHFASTGAMGDWGDLTFDPGWTNFPFAGIESLKVTYSGEGQQGVGWSAMYWQYPPNNWGNLQGSHDLRGVTELRIRMRGDAGGEKVEIKVGGINRPPFHNPDFPFQDSCDLLTTGLITLSTQWTEHRIDLATPEDFYVYREWRGPENHFAPSGWMGDWPDLAVEENWTNNPSAGKSCIKISYSSAGALGQRWAGIYWQTPPNNWGNLGNGFDLRGATKLTFRARTDLSPGQTQTGRMHFFCGGINVPPRPGFPYYDSFKTPQKEVRLTEEWQEFTIDLAGHDLSNVIGGFGWVTAQVDNPFGCTVYLDDIRYDKQLNKDLSQLIGGLCLAVDKEGNPNGCTFYLDDVRFVYADDANIFNHRMAQRGLLPSYEPRPGQLFAPLRNVSFVYDVSLTVLALAARGTNEDLARARILLDAICFAQDNDRYFTDGRLRNAYRAGDLIDPASGKAMQPGWWSDAENQWLEDVGFNSTSTGNLAWAMLALLGYYKYDPNPKYLNAATRLGEWIITNTKSFSGRGGYTGGFEGWEENQIKVEWKSTEHCIDLYAAFVLLSEAIPSEKQKWLSHAAHAKDFVASTWNSRDEWFWTGTYMKDGQELLNEDVVPVDVQAWAMMTMENWRTYSKAISWAEEFCRGQRDGFDGFGFSFNRIGSTTNLNGIWFEGTAQMVVAYQILGKYMVADHFLSQIQNASRTPIADEGKGVPAASRDHHATGFGWEYHNVLHTGASSWYLLAAQKFNPYWQIRTIAQPVNIVKLQDGTVRLTWAGDTDSVFVVECTDRLPPPSGAWDEVARLTGGRGWMFWDDLPNKTRFYRIGIRAP